MKRLAIISTHPIQYNAPFFKELNLSGEMVVKVFYTWSQASETVYDPAFQRSFKWDIPLLEGYEYEFVKNISRSPGSHHFFGVINPSLVKKIKQWKPDFLLVYGWSFVSHLACIKYFKNKVPVLFRGDSTLLDEKKGFKTALRRTFLKWLYRSIDVALYVGKNNYEYYLKHGVPARSLKYLPHVIDNKRFQEYTPAPAAGQFDEIKEKVRGSVVFLFAGKFEPKKDPLIIVNAFNRIRNRNVSLVMVGDGILHDALKTASAANPAIHFLPFQNQADIPGAYRLGDILVLPSLYNETWGLAINEAMACGLAVIASDKVGCAVDLVISGVNGHIFTAGKEDELLKKMELMCDNSLQAMKAASLRMIREYSVSGNAKRLTSILNEVN
jgi:glycosyltransferase involved in cell wall biosynthesis